MPAASKSQQRLMGMVHAYEKGELKLSDLPSQALANKIKDIAKSMKNKDTTDFASTKHKGIPEEVPENVNEMKSDKDMVKDGLKYAKKKFGYNAKAMKMLAKEMLQYIKSGEIDDQAAMEAYIDFRHYKFMDENVNEAGFQGSIAGDARGLKFGTLSDLTKNTNRKEVQKIQNDFVKFAMKNKSKYDDWYDAWKVFWKQNEIKEIIRVTVKELLNEESKVSEKYKKLAQLIIDKKGNFSTKDFEKLGISFDIFLQMAQIDNKVLVKNAQKALSMGK